jgi:hypothetical protein
MEVIAVAALVGAQGMTLLRKTAARNLGDRRPLSFSRKPFKKGLLPGSLVFGLGWGLAGACPGTALVMLGEGKLGAAATIVGLVLGTYLYGRQESRLAGGNRAGAKRAT